MKKKCSICDLEFEIEPGFFQGAMYVSYVFSIAIITAVGIAFHILMEDPPLWGYIAATLFLLIIFLPFMFRYSRVIYLHLFGGVRSRMTDG